MNLAFIGIGVMGLPMASYLQSAGHALAVHTRTNSKAEPLLAKGATWADSPAQAAEHADIVFLCLTDTAAVEAVLLGQGGVIEQAHPGLLVVDHSTISPTATRRFAEEMSKKETLLLDAPVSGGDTGARNATLSIMVGGEESAFERVKPFLHCMGKTITHCGPVGSGQLTKLVNQILVSVTNLAVCEALAFAQAQGLDPQKTLAAVGGGAAGSWQLTNLGPKMLAGDFAPGFSIDLQQKDLNLVLESAKDAGLSLAAVPLVHQLFAQAQAGGLGGRGTQALFQVVKENL
jgi:3-hydroxyisobutyrate dehydrogenase